MTNFDKKIRLYFIECGYIPASTKAEFIYLSKLLLNDMQQQDSPIPMQDDSEKQIPGNATEIHDNGLYLLHEAMLKLEKRRLKAKLKKLEAELPKIDTDQDNG